MTDAPTIETPAPQAEAPPPADPPADAPPATPEDEGFTREQLEQALTLAGYDNTRITALLNGEPPPTPSPEPKQQEEDEDETEPPAEQPTATETPAATQPEQPAAQPRGLGSARGRAPSVSAPLTHGQQYRAEIEKRSYL